MEGVSLLSEMFLWRPRSKGKFGKREFERRFEDFSRDNWLVFLVASRTSLRRRHSKLDEDSGRAQVSATIKSEELVKIPQIFKSDNLAPDN